MKTIIALKGKGGSGKTTTINILYELLVQNSYIKQMGNCKGKGDFTAILQKKNKLIGITSVGDNYDIVYQRLKDFVDLKCEVCVCACRTFDRKGHGTIAAINEFPSYQHIFINKTFDRNAATQTSTNIDDAREIFNEIEKQI